MEHGPGFLALVAEAKRRIRETTCEEVRRRQQAGDRFVLLDVREDGEWQRGRIAGAAHLGKGVIERDVEGRFPDRARALVLYCGGGYRSALAADALRQMGYTDVASMDGGWRRWTELGFPTETD
jgi:rhodanese-related sulfurtransferase